MQYHIGLKDTFAFVIFVNSSAEYECVIKLGTVFFLSFFYAVKPYSRQRRTGERGEEVRIDCYKYRRDGRDTE